MISLICVKYCYYICRKFKPHETPTMITTKIICPHCGALVLLLTTHRDEQNTIDCESCGELFFVELFPNGMVVITYIAVEKNPLTQNNDVTLNGIQGGCNIKPAH